MLGFNLPVERDLVVAITQVCVATWAQPEGRMTSTLERLNSTKKRSKSASMTITIRPAHVVGAAVLLVAIGVSWGAGMRMGYIYAKKDVAYVLETPNPEASVALPKWRAWADQNVRYTPPSDLGMIFDLAGRTIPGTGGMTTGDIWNGYQDRLGRAFFERKAKRYPDVGPAKPAPKRLAGSVATADEPAAIASDASEARPACPPNAQGHRDWDCWN